MQTLESLKRGICAVSDQPCPDKTRSFCQDDAVYTCDYDGYPVTRASCGGDGQRCHETMGTAGWTHAACGLDVACGPVELARCVDGVAGP